MEHQHTLYDGTYFTITVFCCYYKVLKCSLASWIQFISSHPRQEHKIGWQWYRGALIWSLPMKSQFAISTWQGNEQTGKLQGQPGLSLTSHQIWNWKWQNAHIVLLKVCLWLGHLLRLFCPPFTTVTQLLFSSATLLGNRLICLDNLHCVNLNCVCQNV